MKYIIPIYTGWWFQPQYSQYMEKSKCSKPPTSIYIYKCIYIIPNKLINNQQPLIINILIPIYWEYLQRTICIPICASHSLSLSRRLSRLLSESLLVHILASACNSQLACGNHTVSTSLFRCWGSSFN